TTAARPTGAATSRLGGKMRFWRRKAHSSMARRATIIAVINDHFGDKWDVREWRPTGLGWSVAMGWPHGEPRGLFGCGGPRVIATDLLVEYVQDVEPKDSELPIS